VLGEDAVLDVRVAAATNLGRLGTRSAVAPLTAALSPAEPMELRAAAAGALGQLGAASAVPALVALLGDDQFRVAHEAAHALRRLGPAGLDALRAVLARERIDAPADESGTPATPLTPARHAEEALALAFVCAATREPAVAS
jgi:HEAT repeat protein